MQPDLPQALLQKALAPMRGFSGWGLPSHGSWGARFPSLPPRVGAGPGAGRMMRASPQLPFRAAGRALWPGLFHMLPSAADGPPETSNEVSTSLTRAGPSCATCSLHGLRGLSASLVRPEKAMTAWTLVLGVGEPLVCMSVLQNGLCCPAKVARGYEAAPFRSFQPCHLPWSMFAAPACGCANAWALIPSCSGLGSSAGARVSADMSLSPGGSAGRRPGAS